MADNTNTATYADRKNNGKPQLHQIDLNCFVDCAKVLEFGAKKYSFRNWAKGQKYSVLLDSLLRHVAALQRGELIDPESGISHVGHIQANAMFFGCVNNENDLGDS